jgi:hypothetical protein
MTISETYINLDKGYRFGDSGKYEAFTDDKGELYRSCQKEYGRCVSKVYIDPPYNAFSENPQPREVGWVFVKWMQYEDARGPKETYLREVWVTIHDPKVA